MRLAVCHVTLCVVPKGSHGQKCQTVYEAAEEGYCYRHDARLCAGHIHLATGELTEHMRPGCCPECQAYINASGSGLQLVCRGVQEGARAMDHEANQQSPGPRHLPDEQAVSSG